MKLYYFAHPYTGNYAENYDLCMERSNKLLDLGYYHINPLTHSVPLHEMKERSDEFWYEFDLEILKRCDGIILAPKWNLSKGCKLEFVKAKELGLEIIHYEMIT